MRPLFAPVAIAISISISACTIQQTEGKTETVFSPLVMASQPWHISQQFQDGNGDRVCTVSAGEVDVTQRKNAQGVALQVATSKHLIPGHRYKILLAGNYYETIEDWFRPEDSTRIIDDMLRSDKLYTEHRERGTRGQSRAIKTTNNVISLKGFNLLYKNCTDYISAKRK
jgi:hypothetical protein